MRIKIDQLSEMLHRAPPSLRIGQVISNAVDGDVFYVSDDDLVESIRDYVAKHAKPERGA